mmetsp:Transcript_19337/g.54292  ORF Transcript_19337/g.54292 Transcript_19337/m.54292 type:complete len:358 (-) Transcript_19337:648-1721(-)
MRSRRRARAFSSVSPRTRHTTVAFGRSRSSRASRKQPTKPDAPVRNTHRTFWGGTTSAVRPCGAMESSSLISPATSSVTSSRSSLPGAAPPLLDAAGAAPDPLPRPMREASRRICSLAGSRRASSTTAAVRRTVGWAYSRLSGRSSPIFWRILKVTCVARMECPPASKKDSSTPTRRPRTDSQIFFTLSSMSVSVFRSSLSSSVAASSGASSGAGSRRESILPLGVSGMRASLKNTVGTAYAASFSRRKARMSEMRYPLGLRGTKYDTRIFSSFTSRRTFVTHSRTWGCCPRYVSISRSSMRKPRIFTWSSARPMHSTTPRGLYLPRSPVRYMRSLVSSDRNGFCRNLALVTSGRPR